MGNQVLVVDSEDAPQISIHKLESYLQIWTKISTRIMKTMALKERDMVRSKTVVNINVLEEINTSFIYMGCSISYQKEKDITVKITQFMQITGIINVTLKQNLLKLKNTIDLKYITIDFTYTIIQMQNFGN